MARIIRLTESDLTRLIKKVIRESAEDGEIDMSNLQKEIEDFVFRYGNVSGKATDEEIEGELYNLISSENRGISSYAKRLTRRL